MPGFNAVDPFQWRYDARALKTHSCKEWFSDIHNQAETMKHNLYNECIKNMYYQNSATASLAQFKVYDYWTTGNETANETATITFSGATATDWQWVNSFIPVVRTPEEIAAQKAAYAVELEDKRRAKLRARELLCELLTDRQREQLEKENAFQVIVTSGHIYRVRIGHKVEHIDPLTGKPDKLYCIHPEMKHGLPEDDIAISQMLLLKTDEPSFLRTANEFNVHPDHAVIARAARAEINMLNVAPGLTMADVDRARVEIELAA